MGTGGTKGNRGGTGRPPKPVALHVLKGTYRKDRHAKRATTEPDLGDGSLPPPPSTLTKGERVAWDALAPDCIYKIHTKADVHAFRVFVQMWALHQAAYEHIEEEGITEMVEMKDGRTVKQLSGESRIWMDLNGKLLNYFSRFGLTPADRARVQVLDKGGKHGKQEENPDDEFGTGS